MSQIGLSPLAQRLPFSDNAFDIVIATLFLHHLTHAQKIQALCEGRRVLRPGGWLHVADWNRPRRGILAMGFARVRLLDGYERTADHAAGRLGDLLAAYGARLTSRRCILGANDRLASQGRAVRDYSHRASGCFD